MNANFLTPARRISLAIALSVLIHAVILWLPYIQFPQARVQLPPLTVRLEPLAKPVPAIADKLPETKPAPLIPLAKSATSTSVKPSSFTMPVMEKSKGSSAVQPFPKHLQLTFAVYNGEDGFRTGEIHQQLDLHDGRYTLKSVRQTSGLSSLRNSDRFIQTSYGRFDEHGLWPDAYEEERITRNGRQGMRVLFDRIAQKLHYANGEETALPAQTQDNLSFMYQLSQLRMRGEFFTLPVSDAVQLYQYQIEIGAEAEIATPLGKLRTVQLRQMHAPGVAYFQIWLGLEYRLLPVKFSKVDSSGKVTEEMVISGIRARDE